MRCWHEDAKRLSPEGVAARAVRHRQELVKERIMDKDKLVERIFTDLEANGTRRCLLCSAINPCATHSWSKQRDELARNDAEIAALRSHALRNENE